MTKSQKITTVMALTIAVFCGSALAQRFTPTPSTPPAGSPVARHGKLSVSGTHIVGAHGYPVQLRGMSFFWSQPDWGGHMYTAAVTNHLADNWKADVVRVAVNPGTSSDNQIGHVRTVIEAAINKGMYVIIDWHSHSAENEVSAAQSFFSNMVGRYGHLPHVIYEIYNEPINQTWSTIRGYSNTMINYIRGLSNDDGNIIMVGTRDYSKRVDEAAANPLPQTNLVYVAHYYAAQEGHGNEIRGYITAANNAGLAVFITEFGITPACGGQPPGGTHSCDVNHNGQQYTTNDCRTFPSWWSVTTQRGQPWVDIPASDAWFEFLDARRIGWANWAVNDKDEGASAVRAGQGASGLTSNNLTASGTYIRNKLLLYANDKRTLTLNTIGEGNVTVWPGPNYTTFDHGTPVRLTANPATGWTFVGWSSPQGALGSTRELSLAMTQNREVTAVFSQGGENLVRNGMFTEGGSGLQHWTNTQNTTLFTTVASNARMNVTVTAAGTDIDGGIVLQSGIALTQGRRYKITFTANAAAPRPLAVKIFAASAMRATYEVTLGTTDVRYEHTFDYRNSNQTNAQLRFCFGGSTVNWSLADVRLEDVGAATSVALTAAARPQTWSLTRAAGALTLRGPVDAGARVTLYDIRGKALRTTLATNGMTLGQGLPAGNYFVVVRTAAGKEVYRNRVSMVR